MEIIKASSEFNLEDMHSSLMLYGYYCYHDSRLEGIVPEDLHFEYVPSVFGQYGTSICEEATKVLVQTQLARYSECFPELKVIRSLVYSGIDNGVGVWHTDHRENLRLQAMCYQSDLFEADGGSLQIKCYDGVERHYYPKNGDIVLTNHSPDVVHKIDTILTDKKRIVINMVMQ